MLRGLIRLAGGIVALGASVFAAVAATGVCGDGLAEVFGDSEEEKRAETRKAS